MNTTGTEPTVSRRDRLEQFVRARTIGLQKRLEAGDSSARAALARLRRAAGAGVEERPEAWAEVYAEFPTELAGDDEVGVYENAAHVALTLFALHQQSQAQSMQATGPAARFGSAVRRLATPDDAQEHDQAILRRFRALVTADEFPEIVYHLRGIVLLLKAGSIPLDYGRLAADLASLQTVDGSTRVKLRWARDLYTAPRRRAEPKQSSSER